MFRRKFLIVVLILAALSLACSLTTIIGSGNQPSDTGSSSQTFLSGENDQSSPGSTPTTADEEDTSVDASVDIPYPLMDDASDLEDNFGLYSYTTDHTVEEIVAFYKAELPSMDLTLTSDVVGSDFAVLSFSPPDDHPITLNVITNDQGKREVRLTD